MVLWEQESDETTVKNIGNVTLQAYERHVKDVRGTLILVRTVLFWLDGSNSGMLAETATLLRHIVSDAAESGNIENVATATASSPDSQMMYQIYLTIRTLLKKMMQQLLI